ncbi:MAG: J domain-containing protein [Ostreibacterium sp.]
MQKLVYLVLVALGFTFGKYVGAVGLPLVYFIYRRRTNQPTETQHYNASSIASIDWAYQVLRVSPSADAKTIMQARKKQLNQFHPDKLGQVSETEKKLAEEKINQINRAYATIRQVKGL